MAHVVVKNVFRKESIGFIGLLTIALVSAKVKGLLDIEWLWVFAPLWWPAFFVIGLVLAFLVLIIITLFLAIIVLNAVKIVYHLT
ncbi:MAG: hypothetical protein WBL02_05830 [Methanomethylovorans sp.]|uniref:hypothetical protein n=1 Tax=Methanomethylovorans sp. TaxID=2758717 RepID=UPI000A91385B|nr:hypothetical protein [Methanomethylovorans sp.]